MSGNTKKTTTRRIQIASVAVAILASVGFTGLVGTLGYMGKHAEALDASGQLTLTAPSQPQVPGTTNPRPPGVSSPQRRPPAAVIPRSPQSPRIRSRGS